MLVCSFWAVSRTRWAGRGAVGGGGPPRRACRGPSPGHGADAVGAGARGRWGGVQRYRASARRVGAVRAGRASGTTAYRTMAGIDEACLERVWDTAAGVRAAEWSQQCVDPARPLVLDIDSTLVEVHSENKQGAAPHYKRGYGFHPMLCSTGDGDPLWAKLRPGNAAANNIADHLEVLDRSIGQLPEGSAAGHRPGDEPAMAAQPIWVRTDSAGCSTRAAHGARDRNVTFFAAARQSTQITAANRRRSRRPGPLAAHHQEPQAAPRTRPGRRPHRQSRPVGLARGHTADHPAASRCTPARRARCSTPPTGAAGDSSPTQKATPPGSMAPCAPTPASRTPSRRLKDSGLNKTPFRSWDANAAWTALCVISLALVTWFQQLRLRGALAKAAPKRLRWQLWHTPARIVHSARHPSAL